VRHEALSDLTWLAAVRSVACVFGFVSEELSLRIVNSLYQLLTYKYVLMKGLNKSDTLPANYR